MVKIAGILVSALIAFVGAIVIGELIGFWIYPPTEVPYEIVDLPRGAQALIVLAWLGGAAAAALTARLLGSGPWLVALAPTIAIAYAGASMTAEPHPPWMIAAGLAGPLLIAAAFVFAGRRS